jgi:hypothetical protein
MERVGSGTIDASGYDDGMSSIVTAGTTRADIDLCRQYVNELSFTFISPLRAEDNRY